MFKSKLTLNMVVADAIKAMEFYEAVFGAVRGDVYHFHDRANSNEANIILGDVCLRLIDENNAYDCYPPKTGEVDSIWLQLKVEDTDSVLEKAKLHGAAIGSEPSEFMGVRHAEITDPFGYIWTVNQVLKEISFEERYRIYEEIHLEEDK